MQEWFEHIIDAVRGSPEEPVLAAHVAVVALHAALLAGVAGFVPNASPVRMLHAYDRIILDRGRRSAWVTHLFNRETVEINLHGGTPTRGLQIDWTLRRLDLDAILGEARRQAEGVMEHLAWRDEQEGGDE